ncbi:MAG TPA: IS200/IS605 family transposase [Lutibacter sp.]|nr:IS200/IS605 family transposase [Lutibacter sp.]
MTTEHILKSHNKSLLMYQLVCPIKYRRKVLTKEVETSLKNICTGLEKRYEVSFIEIGADNDYVYFLIQSVPNYSPAKLANLIKGVTAREIFKRHPNIKKEILWGGNFWTAGYYINTVGKFANEEMMKNYIKNQRTVQQSNYKRIHFNKNQASLF